MPREAKGRLISQEEYERQLEIQRRHQLPKTLEDIVKEAKSGRVDAGRLIELRSAYEDLLSQGSRRELTNSDSPTNPKKP